MVKAPPGPSGHVRRSSEPVTGSLREATPAHSCDPHARTVARSPSGLDRRHRIRPFAELVQRRLGGHGIVSEEEAQAAIERGELVVIDDTGSLQNLADIPLANEPAKTAPWYAIVLAYRQAGMFVNYLRESDEPAFDRMMNEILEGRAFSEAVTVGYHADVQSLWQKFTHTSAERK